ncbi:DinB family protein [Altibacter sp.]|uniref:DinB family protein n=1 Tax=Altibacter sp. TaxID=2024823 RepID=UPI000C8ED652|nr:DinB family protein [Altibacter sp.]MAP54853.1 damage-inducible protein DinB [Altibacter sp.]
MKAVELSPSEYHPYFEHYIRCVREKSLMEGLTSGLIETQEFFEEIPTIKHEYQYASGKWSPKEILLHLIDSERVFCSRALHFARARNTELPGFDENEFASNSHANGRTMNDLLDEFVAVRTSTVLLFKSFSNDALLQKGKANNAEVSVRALGFLIAGHAVHHVQVIQERYL